MGSHAHLCTGVKLISEFDVGEASRPEVMGSIQRL